MMPMKREFYHSDWERISLLVRERAGHKCELCGRARGNIINPGAYSSIVVTVHHINGDPSDNRKSNLIALCQRCHLRLDLPFKLKRRRQRKGAEA